MNLLKETITSLGHYDLSPEDVLWIGIRDGSQTTNWKDFAIMADREYDEGYGGVEILETLVVVGKDWWLERHEYDGSEWWEYKTLPTLHSQTNKLKIIFQRDL